MEDGYDGLKVDNSINPNSTEKNSPLTYEALMQLTSNLGNDETKLITIAAMEPGVFYGQRGLARRVESFLGGMPSPYVGKSNYGDYCGKSFVPVGLVESRQGERDGRDAPEYMVTPYGATIGTAFAGHLLQFSERYPDVSLYGLLGSTKSAAIDEETGMKKTSPELRFKIYYELLTANLPIRMEDLARALGAKSEALKRHMDELDLEEIISFKSAGSLGPIVEYRINKDQKLPEELPKGTKYPVLTKEIYSLVQELTEKDEEKWTTINEVTKVVPMRTTGSFADSQSPDSTRSVVLKKLADAGYLVRKEFDGLSKSNISLTPEQRQVLLELTSIIDNFQSQKKEFIEDGIRKANEILSDPTRTQALMSKAKDNSPSAAKIPQEEMKKMILGAISDTGEVEAKDLLEPVKNLYGKKIRRVHTREILGVLAQEGVLKVREENNRKYWSRVPVA